MFRSIIDFSIKNKLIVLLATVALIVAGIYSAKKIPIDAVPDITNNQVQVVTVSPTLSPQEVEKFITYPLENSLRNLPRVTLVRSISRFGLSIITVIFEDNLPILKARQYVKEQIDIAKGNIPPGLGEPELMPITTGLGEIYQYILKVKPGYESRYDAMKLRTIQDWIVQRQLAGVEGLIEVSAFGGYLKQYEVAVNPNLLQSFGLSLNDVHEALKKSNQNSGSGYIQKGHDAFYIRTEGMVKNLDEIEKIIVSNAVDGTPITVRDIAKVKFGSAQRFGAMTMDGKGEVVGGITLMFKGANTHETIERVKKRIEKINKSLPEGIEIYPYLERAKLIDKAISTVKNNLLEGGLIVIFVLVLMLGNIRSGLIVSSVIPLSLLFAFVMMDLFGVSANLLSMGAIDFGIVVDGAVIIVEGVLHALYLNYLNKRLTQKEMDQIVSKTAGEIYQSAAFGVLIILVVFVPIMTLTGIEGKMFRPMAQTVSFAILGAFILSLTYVPVMMTLFANKNIQSKTTFSDRLINAIKKAYLPVLKKTVRIPYQVMGGAIALFMISIVVFRLMGSEFIPTLEEGDLAMQMSIKPGSSLNEAIAATGKIERILKKNFPEVRHVVSKIGTAEVPTDPMSVEEADIAILLKDKNEWSSASSREGLAEKMKEKLSSVLGVAIEFNQPIQLRFNELIAGAKSDIVIKVFGEDLDKLKEYAECVAKAVETIPGAGDVRAEQISGLKQLRVSYNRDKIAQHGISVFDLNQIIQASNSGLIAGAVFEGEKRFDMVVRLDDDYRKIFSLDQLFIKNSRGVPIPLSEVAEIEEIEGPTRISRENAQRRIYVGVNIRNRDVAGLVAEIQEKLEKSCKMDPGYYISYGGAFENLQEAQARLLVAIPISLLTIIFLLYLTFNSLKYAMLIFSAVPMAAIGGVFALWARGMPFSVSAGVGFIALFGVAVLNGIVLVSHLNNLKNKNPDKSLRDIIYQGALDRLRPVLMTAAVATLGFLPMAISTSNGAEVQRPLATVVIGGLITSTILTLLVLPAAYYLIEQKAFNRGRKKLKGAAVVLLFLILPMKGFGQASISLQEAIDAALKNNPLIENARSDIALAETEKNYAFSLGDASLETQYGQLNGDKGDYELRLSQDFGNLFSIKNKRAVGQSMINVAGAELTLTKRQLARDVAQAYNHWLYLQQKKALFASIKGYYQTAVQRIDIRYERGESDFVEREFLRSQSVEIYQQEAQIQRELSDTEAQLKQLCFFPAEEKLIAKDRFKKLSSRADADDKLSGVLMAAEQEKIRLSQERIKLQRALRLPSVQLGYLNKSIDRVASFNAAVVGVSVPLFDRSFKMRLEQAKISKEIAQADLRIKWKNLQTSLESLKQQRQTWEKNFSLLGEDYTQRLEKMRKAAELKYLEGEIDYINYAQILRNAIQSELTYLDLIDQYNHAVILLEYLTQN